MAAGGHRPMARSPRDVAPDATVEPTGALCERAPSAPAQKTGQKNLRSYLRAIRVNAALRRILESAHPTSSTPTPATPGLLSPHTRLFFTLPVSGKRHRQDEFGEDR